MHVSKRMFAEFETYWRHLQEQAVLGAEAGTKSPVVCIPTRKQFNPMAMPKLLPNLFMIEYRSQEELIVRLTGTAIDDALESSITHQNILDYYSGEERDFFRTVYCNIATVPCGAVLKRYVTLSNGRGYNVTGKSLPLAGDDGKVKYVVGMMGADLLHLSPLGERAVVAGTSVTDFFYMDLGAGVPDEEPRWLKVQQAG